MWEVNKLKITFVKGCFVFAFGAFAIIRLIGEALTYLELEMFNGELPDSYRTASFLLMLFLLLLLAIPTMIKPIRAINIEKERRINKWHITGIPPDEQEDA